MAQPTTAKFGKMRVMLGEKAFAANVTATSVSNTNPTQITVGAADISKFSNGITVKVAGLVAAGMTAANGDHTIYSVGSPTNTFKLSNVSTAAGVAPVTTGVTVAPKTGATSYVAPCGLTTKSLALSKNLTEVSIPDCDDPDAPLWLGRDVQNLSVQISGDGVAAAESVPDWNDAAVSTIATPMKVEIEFSSGQKTFTGNFHIDNLTFGAEQGGRVTVSFNAQSDGTISDLWVPLP